MVWWLGLGAVALTTALIILFGPAPALFIVLGLIALGVVLWRPRVTVYATIVLAFITLPTAVPTVFAIGPISFRAYEFTLALAATYLFFTVKATVAANWLTGSLAFLAAGGLLLGLVNGNSGGNILTDVRWLVILILGFIAASRVVRSATMMRTTVRIIPWILWISAGFLLAGSLFGLPLAGRTEAASLADTSDVNEATRLLTPTNFLALAVISGVIALAIAGRVTFRSTLHLTAPATLVLFLAFSRNSIVGLVAAIAFALIVNWSMKAFLRVLGISAALIVIGATLVTAEPVIAQLPGGDWVNKQVKSYTTRVVDGLDASTQATDPSTQFREVRENQLIIPRIQESPVIGHGFGYAYKAAYGPPGTFEHDLAFLYAHNYYLWLTVKTGILGMAIFGLFVAWPVVASWRRRTPLNISLTAGVVALAACSVVAPMANGSPTSLLFGALVGAVAGAGSATSHGSFAPGRHRTTSLRRSPESRQLQPL